MPRAAYIMFSESGAVDQYTNRVSVFDVIEVVQVRPVQTQTPDPSLSSPPMGSFRLVVVWLKEDGDGPEDTFEHQVRCFSPKGEELFTSPIYPFKFNTLFHRFDVAKFAIPGYAELGIYTVEARLRPAGQQEWILRQSFPFVVQESPSPRPPDGPLADTAA